MASAFVERVQEALAQVCAVSEPARLALLEKLEADVRAEVESLLRAGDELELPDPDALGPALQIEPPPPQIVPGYRLSRFLGRGGQAVVYAAMHLASGREVAVKLRLDRAQTNDGPRNRFEEGSRLHTRVKHPGIVPVTDLGTCTDGSPFLVTELIDGVALNEYLGWHAADDRGAIPRGWRRVWS